MTSSISFWKQNDAYRAASASANDQLFNDTTASKLFTKANPSASTVPSVLTPTDPYAIINGFGQAVLNHSMSAAILAAKAANDRVAKQTTAANNQMTTKPVGDHSVDVTFSGALSVNFGADGPAMGGGYGFLSGKDLKTAFKAAVGSKKSNGEAVDTVRVEGETLIGSTSGANAHDVFTLTLHKDSGLYTFQLLAPIDQKTTKGSYSAIYLNGLMQARSATGQKMSLPKVEVDVYNDLGMASSKKNWGLLHEAALTYKDPSTTSSSTTTSSTTTTTTSSSSTKTTKTAYTAPTDTRTNYAYTSNPSAALGVINAVNIFS
jgi:hypothetical protein